MHVVRLYIVDENEPVRTALAARLQEAKQVYVAGHASNPEFVLRDVIQATPDVVLVEVKRSDGLGLELIRRLKDLDHAPRTAVLTSYPSAWEEAAARRAGASAYFLKDIAPDDLVAQILAVL